MRERNLCDLIESRAVLAAQWARLWAARYEDDGEGDGEQYEAIGARMASVRVGMGHLDAQIAEAMDRAGLRQCWHRGQHVECLSPYPGRVRIRVTTCPTAAEVVPLYRGPLAPPEPTDAEIDEAAAFAAIEDVIGDGVGG